MSEATTTDRPATWDRDDDDVDEFESKSPPVSDADEGNPGETVHDMAS